MRAAALMAMLLMMGCGEPEEGPTMAPGENCLSCHSGGGEEGSWTVAGTVYGAVDAAAEDGLASVEVQITDDAGKEVTLNSNSAGNFYTAEAFTFPIHVAVQKNGTRVAMGTAPASGACNSCHTPGGSAPGRLYVP